MWTFSRVLKGLSLCIVLISLNGCIAEVSRHIVRQSRAKPHLPQEYDVYIKNFYIDPDFKHLRIRRVGVVPFVNLTEVPRVAREVTETFVTELQKSGHFEVIDLKGVRGGEKLYEQGMLDKQKVFDLSSEYLLDAVIYGSIIQYRAMDPFRLGLSLNMVRSFDASVIWSAEDIFDASSKPQMALAKAYYQKFVAETHPLMGWKVLKSSMRRFTRFVSYLFVDSYSGRTKPAGTKKRQYF